MLKKAIVVAGATAGLVGLAPLAHADMKDNDGVNVLNGNNLSVLPIQACGNNVAALGLTIPIASPQNVKCVNAPIVDHPHSES